MSYSHDFLVYSGDEKMPSSSTGPEEFPIPGFEEFGDFEILDSKDVSDLEYMTSYKATLNSLGKTLLRADSDNKWNTTKIGNLINLYNQQPNNRFLLIELISCCNAYDLPRFFLAGNRKIIATTIPQIRDTAIAMVRNLIKPDSSTSFSAAATPGLFPPRDTSSDPKTTEQKLNDFIREYLIDPLEKGSILDSLDDYLYFKLSVLLRIFFNTPFDKKFMSLRYCVQYLRQLKDDGFTAGELRKAGFSARELGKAGFSARELGEAGFSARELLKEVGFSAIYLKYAGFSLRDLIEAGLSARELREALFSPRELREATNKHGRQIFSDDDILHAGFSARQLRFASFSIDQLIEAGFSARELKEAGFSAWDLKEAGYTASHLRTAGFSARELKEATDDEDERIFSDDQILHAGFSALELRLAGYTASHLRTAGFSARELSAGFPANQLIDADYTLEQLKDAGYTVYELLSFFNKDDLIKAGFIDAEIDAGIAIYVSILELIQYILKEIFKKYCFVRCINRPEEEKALLFDDEMALLREKDPKKAEYLKKQYTFRSASFIAQGLPFRLFQLGLFALYSNKSELARLAGSSTPFWGKQDLGSDWEWLIKNGADPLTLTDSSTEVCLETSSIEDYIAELHESKSEVIDMPEVLGNFKIENLLAIGIYIGSPAERSPHRNQIEKQLENVKDFHEFLISKGVFVPLTIYTLTDEHSGELEIFTEWKSFEYAVLAAIDRLEDEPD